MFILRIFLANHFHFFRDSKRGKTPKSLEKQRVYNLVLTSQINLRHISWSCDGQHELKYDGYSKEKASLYIMLEHVAKVMDLRAGEACVPSGSQHSSGPVLQRGHGKERIWQLKVISTELKLVLYFRQSDYKSLFLFFPCLSELKTARIEEPEILPFFPTSNHGVSIFPCYSLVLWEVDGLSQSAHSSDVCSLLSSPLLSSESWGLHTSIQKAAWQELSPPQGKVQIFCGGGVKGNRGAGKIGHSTS